MVLSNSRVFKHSITRTVYSSSVLLQAMKAKEVESHAHNKLLTITWENGSTNRYPFVYLRDNCRCPSCFHESSQQRYGHMAKLNIDVAVSTAHVSESGGKISITWEDGHVSEFNSDWLLTKRLPEKNVTKEDMRARFVDGDVRLWGSELNENIVRFSFESMLSVEKVLLEWLLAMRRYGLALITGVPREQGQVERLGDAVGFLRTTLYGKTSTLRSEANARSLAYTNYELQPHTDLPYYEFKPGVILLQCIDQVRAPGGENTLVDGFKVVREFKREQPHAFDLMASTPVLHRVIGREEAYGEFEQTFARPIIELDVIGQIARINFNEPLRECFLNTPVEKMAEVYRAYQSLTSMFYEPRFIVNHKMSEGEMLTMDNDRLLHGRTAFEVSGEEKRWLEQAYVDWDILRSKTNILQTKHRGHLI